MFSTSKPSDKFYGLHTSFNPKHGDISNLMSHVKSNSTKILNLYFKYLIQSYHMKSDTLCRLLKPDQFQVGMSVLFNQKRTNVTHSYRLFYLGVVSEILYHRNSDSPRTFMLRCYDHNKIITKALRPEDTLIINSQGSIGFIYNEDLKNLSI